MNISKLPQTPKKQKYFLTDASDTDGPRAAENDADYSPNDTYNSYDNCVKYDKYDTTRQ